MEVINKIQNGYTNGHGLGSKEENSNGFHHSKTLTLENMNPSILALRQMDSIIRGPVISRAQQIISDLKNGVKKPFEQVITANIGDAHAMGNSGITFIRQMLALISYPELMEVTPFPEDVKAKAKTLLAHCNGNSIGAYTMPRGMPYIRSLVSDYITKRDGGIPADPDDIFLSNGASDAIRACLKLFRSKPGEKKTGILTPVPQFPIFAASITEYDMMSIEYYSNEPNAWATEITELRRAITEAKKVCKPRAIVVVNPGNPTGSVLTRDNIVEIIKFAYQENLFILADEVYQDNVYRGAQFLSFKKVMMQMSYPYNQMELASVFSCSKGFAGECGLRGGYCELVNLDPDVKQMVMTSVVATKLCPTSAGQTAVACLVNSPQPGDPSFPLFNQEKMNVLNTLEKKAKFLEERFAKIPALHCQPIEGAMYAFPQIFLPPKAILAAKEQGLEPDELYALQLLESTGICVVPGTAVGQVPGTYHFRTTLLPPLETLERMMDMLQDFHESFINNYQ